MTPWRAGYPPMPKPKNALGFVRNEKGEYEPAKLHVPYCTREEFDAWIESMGAKP